MKQPKCAWYSLLPFFSRLMGFGRSAAAAGADLAFLATEPALENVTGRYFSGRDETSCSPESYDQDKAADLWQTSVELAGLQPGESPLTHKDLRAYFTRTRVKSALGCTPGCRQLP